MRIIKTLFATVLLCTGIVRAQVFLHGQLTAKDGLSHNVVYRIAQHPETGYMWFGTNNGLNRYNGNDFEVYGKNISAQQGVLAMAPVDSQSMLVSFFGGGIYRFKIPESSTAISATTDIKLAIKILPLSDGSTLLITSKGEHLLKLHPTNQIDTLYTSEPAIIDFAMSPEGVVCLATKQGLIILENQQSPPVELMTDQHIHWVEFVNGELWFAKGNEIWKLVDSVPVQIVRISTIESIHLFSVDSKGAVWVVPSSGGLLFYANERVIDLAAQIDMPDVVIQDITEDSNGTVWIATRGDGVLSFQLLRSASGYSGLPHKSLYLWTGTQLPSGELILGGDNSLFVCKDGKCRTPELPGIDAWVFVYGMISSGNQAIINTNRGVLSYEGGTGSFELLSEDVLISMVESPEGIRYASFIDGATYSIDSDDTHTFLFHCHSRVQSSIFHNGHLTIFSDSSLYNYYPGSETLIKESLPNTFVVNDVIEDHTGKLWCATSRGLYSYDGFQWKSFSKGSSAPNCKSLSMDSMNRIWIGTSNGLLLSDTLGNFETILSAEVLNNEEVGLLLEGQNGDLHVGTDHHFFTLKHIESIESVSSPRLLVGALNAGGNSYHPHHRSIPIRLPHENGNVSLSFDAVNLQSWKNSRVEYRLLPRQEQWSETKNKTLVFNALPSNDYVLEMRAVNAYEANKAAEYSLSFAVNHPWWNHWLARLSGILILMAVMVLLVKTLNDYQRKKYEQRMNTEMLKMRALNNYLNPHFLSNALNSIRHLLRQHKVSEAMEYIKQFAYLLRKNLEHLNTNSISIQEEESLLNAYLAIEQLRFDNHFQHEFTVSEDLDKSLQIPFMVIQPFVENAIWHGILPLESKEAGMVSVHLDQTKDKKHLKIRIRDNGVGFEYKTGSEESEEGRASGIAMVSSRLSLMDKDSKLLITSHSKEMPSAARGTCVEVLLSMAKLAEN